MKIFFVNTEDSNLWHLKLIVNESCAVFTWCVICEYAESGIF